eukprot:GSA120T00013119001.1
MLERRNKRRDEFFMRVLDILIFTQTCACQHLCTIAIERCASICLAGRPPRPGHFLARGQEEGRRCGVLGGSVEACRPQPRASQRAPRAAAVPLVCAAHTGQESRRQISLRVRRAPACEQQTTEKTQLGKEREAARGRVVLFLFIWCAPWAWPASLARPLRFGA